MAVFSALRKLPRKLSRRDRRLRRQEVPAGDISAWTRDTANHVFTSEPLLRQAMAHRSWCAEHGGKPSNERLEFLGDAILQWIVTDLIFEAHPSLNEGALTDLRKSLVNAETLANIAVEIKLGQWLQLGAGEDAAGGRFKGSILADALEALIGALYLDGGADKVRAFVTHLMGDRIIDQAERLDEFDARSHLIRICVREFTRPPVLEITSSGAPHQPIFTARVVINGEEMGAEIGRTKKAAAEAASTIALSKLQSRGIDIGRA